MFQSFPKDLAHRGFIFDILDSVQTRPYGPSLHHSLANNFSSHDCYICLTFQPWISPPVCLFHTCDQVAKRCWRKLFNPTYLCNYKLKVPSFYHALAADPQLCPWAALSHAPQQPYQTSLLFQFPTSPSDPSPSADDPTSNFTESKKSPKTKILISCH